ncbi:hypothetical protein HNQ88_003483 [Aureibacter tunicatorum]|uniref:Uncharacterized protein n=1 Tax=Aureibacter tunicatorum TaxID=866807 RepID=A0AAE4BU75_9BACT|nr:hypothetical protein [Aureibacter tunicatorum]
MLIIDLGCYDIWLYANDQESKPHGFEPKSITPKFVSKSIAYALTQGWSTDKMELEFRNGNYNKK